jgi:ceramide glucosyltransferase
VLITVLLLGLTLLGLALLLWQAVVAARFPLHRRETDVSFAPAVTILKPLRGCDEHTADCLRSWFGQDYRGPVQLLLGVADENDPVCFVVRELLRQFPRADAELIITHEAPGPNAKVGKLIELERRARHEVIVVSDADVRVPKDFLQQAVIPLRDPGTGLVNCFYQLANPATPAMRWEAVAVNADFWSQVLQSNSLRPQDFALGAVMLTRRAALAKMGGFAAVLDYLADDYQLGHQMAATGARIALAPVVVECWDRPMDFRAVWRHQLRWARTIRVSRPRSYLLSLLGHVTLWAALLALFGDLGGFPLVPDAMLYSTVFATKQQAALGRLPVPWVLVIFLGVILIRVLTVAWWQRRFTRRAVSLTSLLWLVPTKDFLAVALWAASFLGNAVEWRGRKYRLDRAGRLVPLDPAGVNEGAQLVGQRG